MYTRPLRSNELYHSGILGMIWGVRRYQNKDGTLTPLGKQRYSKGANKSTNQQESKDNITPKNSQTSSTSNNHSAAKAYIKKKLSYAGDKLVDSLIKKGTNYAAEKIMTKMFDDYKPDKKDKK